MLFLQIKTSLWLVLKWVSKKRVISHQNTTVIARRAQPDNIVLFRVSNPRHRIEDYFGREERRPRNDEKFLS